MVLILHMDLISCWYLIFCMSVALGQLVDNVRMLDILCLGTT